MNAQETVALELIYCGQVQELIDLPPDEARERLAARMNAGWRWRVQPPTLVGEDDDADLAKYRRDCELVGRESVY